MSDLYDLPNGWEWKKLDNIGKVFSGSSAPQKEEYFLDGKYPFIRTKDLATYGRTNNLTDVNDYINDKCINDSKLVLAKKGTTLFPKSGASIGTNNRAMIGFDSYIVSHLGAFFSDEEVTNKYIYNYFLTIDLLDYCENPSYPSLKISRVKEIDIPLPPLSEQQRIVSKLDNLFEKIDKSIALHQKNMDEVNVFMGSVLSDVFGELEEKYELIKINDVVVKTNNVNPMNDLDKPFTYIDISSIDNKSFKIIEPKQLIGSEAPSRAKKEVLLGDIVYSTTRPNLKNISIVNEEYDNPIASTGFCVLRVNDKTINSYLFYYLITDKLFEQIEPNIRGAQYPATSDKDLKNCNIPNTPLQIQHKVVKYLDEVSEKIEKVKSIQKDKMDSLKALKASILDRAFRGEL
jgi:type I restriction enzyme S subunit